MHFFCLQQSNVIQRDLYPLTPSNKPSMGAREWIDQCLNRNPNLTDLLKDYPLLDGEVETRDMRTREQREERPASSGRPVGTRYTVLCSSYLIFFLNLWETLWCNNLHAGLQIELSIFVCSCARHLTLIVPLSTQEYKWMPAKCQDNMIKCRDYWEWTAFLFLGEWQYSKCVFAKETRDTTLFLDLRLLAIHLLRLSEKT